MTEDAFIKLAGLIEAAHTDFPDGNFSIRIPADVWMEMEESLNRSPVQRHFLPDAFVWRGEYVENKGETWAAWPIKKTV